ncbi:MAG: hypothetical protein NTY83_03320 [Candidatus Micrarchaeota archaeon]|nr:hypothetical protein [Candidatus Micrarchaeota archaeon]
MRIEMATGAFTRGIETVSKMGKELFLEFFKVYLVGVLSIFLGVIVVLLATSAFGTSPWPFMAITIAAILVVALLATGIMTVPMNIINEKLSNAPVLGIIGNTKRNMLPVVAFYFIMILIIGIFAYAPLFIAMEAGGPAFIAGYIYYYLAVFAISFLLQFGIFELVVSRSGVLGSFGKSFDIVKKNFWETLVYYIGMFGISLAAAVAIGIVLLIALAIPVMLGIALASAIGNQTFSLVLLGIGILYLWFLYMAYMAGVQAVVLPIQYHYWKAAREVR